ncbi:hypothetical protein F443_16717 [Phytophthora nicotianae P1569]|uniref:Uncharacterized protein n=1 Tax=Phytophthora nicotianae P1569 TaxID=1317065 RepID=V9EDR5_PHYNI|nr:hypothetical protein F443_16717 [Phytophthora nicotianae P1569]
MSPYFRNNKILRRYLGVNDKVRDSAFRDFKKAIKSSLALFFALKKKNKNTTFPELKFKSKFALSNTIEIYSRSIKSICVVEWGSQNHAAIHSDTQCPGLPTDGGVTPITVGLLRAHLVYPSAGLDTLLWWTR